MRLFYLFIIVLIIALVISDADKIYYLMSAIAVLTYYVIDMTKENFDHIDNSDISLAHSTKADPLDAVRLRYGENVPREFVEMDKHILNSAIAGRYGLPDNIYPIENTKLANEMMAHTGIAQGRKSKMALDGAVRSTRDQYEKFFKDELAENENRSWWGGESYDF